MAVSEQWVPAPVEDVWAIVADPRAYAFWVVGSHDIRRWEGEWPGVGATFHHTQGHGPFKLKDTSTVLECEPPRRLVLEVRIRPFAVGRVELTFTPEREGTCMRIDEVLHGGMAGVVPNALIAPFMNMRNEDGLRRLAGMAWTRAATLGRAPDDQGADGSGTTPRSSASATKARA